MGDLSKARRVARLLLDIREGGGYLDRGRLLALYKQRYPNTERSVKATSARRSLLTTQGISVAGTAGTHAKQHVQEGLKYLEVDNVVYRTHDPVDRVVITDLAKLKQYADGLEVQRSAKPADRKQEV